MVTFSFNLLPKKSKEEKVKEEKRDDASVYSAILPLVAVVSWLALTIFNGVVVDRTKENWQKSVEQRLARINGEYLPVRVQHGELVLKTRALAEIIQKDIQPETLFVLTEKIFPTPEADVTVVGYGRNDDGSFDLNLITQTYIKPAQIARRLTNYEGAKNVVIKSIAFNNESDTFTAVINFSIDEQFVAQDV